MIYSQAQTPDGEPVAVEEPCGCDDGYRYVVKMDGGRSRKRVPCSLGCTAGTRPCSWALILPGDEVTVGGYQGRVSSTNAEEGCWISFDDPHYILDDWYSPADLTLMCGEPSELRRRNPAWCWPC